MTLITAVVLVCLAVSIVAVDKKFVPRLLLQLIGSSTAAYLLPLILLVSVLSSMLGGVAQLQLERGTFANPAVLSVSLIALVVTISGFAAVLIARHLGYKIDREKAALIQAKNALRASEDGSYKWILDRGKVVAWTDDLWPQRMIGTHTDITERKQMQEQVRKLASDNAERVKEATCLYAVAEAIYNRVDLDEIFQEVADLIPAGWHYPELTRAKIVFDDKEYVSEPFDETVWRQVSAITVGGVPRGSIAAYYVAECPELDEGPFMFEERYLLNELSSKLGRAVEAKEAQNRSLLSEQSLRLHREQTPLGVIEWDKDLRVTYWNPAAESIFGYSLREVRGRNLLDFMVADCAKVEVRQVWDKLMSVGHASKCINEYVTKDGRKILCEWHNTALKDHAGEVIGAASLVVDITEQHAAQQVSLVKEQEQREILDFMPDAVVGTDETGSITSFNKAAEALFGYRYEEIIGHSVNQLMPSPAAAKHDGYMQRYLKTGESHVMMMGREVRGQHKSGQMFPMRLSMTELPADASGKRRFIGNCQDLTETRRQQEQLRRSDRMEALGKLTGGIAHDFNNMLTAVTGYTELLAGSLREQPELVDYVHEIHRAGERGKKLTRKLLSFSRKEEAKVEKMQVNELLQEQRNMLQKTLTVRIKLVLDLASDNWPVMLDSGDLEEAIVNMSINAMHALEGKESGARLTICTHNLPLNMAEAKSVGVMPGDYVQISVADNGTGMDEATAGKIFDPFFSTKGEHGTGLGLSQVYGFVSRSGGAITVESAPGKGSKFVIYLPRCIDDDFTATIANKVETIVLGGTESILVVDDEAGLRRLASKVLSQQGYQVFSADGAEQALQVLGDEHIDLMFSDVIMPGMSGYQLAVAVREMYPDVKIQLASGFVDDKSRVATDESLHQDLISKPYKAQALLAKIRYHLDNKPQPNKSFVFAAKPGGTMPAKPKRRGPRRHNGYTPSSTGYSV